MVSCRMNAVQTRLIKRVQRWIRQRAPGRVLLDVVWMIDSIRPAKVEPRNRFVKLEEKEGSEPREKLEMVETLDAGDQNDTSSETLRRRRE